MLLQLDMGDQGVRVMIDSYDTFIDDVFTHLDEVKKEYPDIPVYVFGHSMVSHVLTARRFCRNILFA